MDGYCDETNSARSKIPFSRRNSSTLFGLRAGSFHWLRRSAKRLDKSLGQNTRRVVRLKYCRSAVSVVSLKSVSGIYTRYTVGCLIGVHEVYIPDVPCNMLLNIEVVGRFKLLGNGPP